MTNLAGMTPAEKLRLLELLEEKERRLAVQYARDDLLGFAKRVYPNYSVGAHHRRIAALLKDVVEGKKRRVILNMPPRHGKLIADDTPVLTPAGWSTHGELRVGDYVFSPSGRPVRVVAVSQPASADVRVEFFNGEVVYCHEGHEWTMHTRHGAMETFETRRFLQPRRGRWGETSGRRKQVTSGGRALFFLPSVEPLQFEPLLLPLHPYVLGAWLGDGSAGKPCVTHAAGDQPYVDKIVACGYPVSARCVHRTTGAITTYFAGPRPNVRGALTARLQALGVYNAKHIPTPYLRASVAQRLELLAGLLDTDGHVDRAGRCRFTSVNWALVEGVVELVRSFGWHASVSKVQPRTSSSGIVGRQAYWVVGFQPTLEIPVALPRKKVKRLSPQRRIGLRSVELDPCGKVGKCIQVASSDGLYLVGKMLIPTHNSELASYLFPAWYLGKHPNRQIIMATHTASLSEDFGGRVRNLIATPEYAEIFADTQLADDKKGAGSWNTSAGGKYFAAGVGGSIAGRGAHLLLIDDPHALPLDTEVPTPHGFKTIAQLQVGDAVYGPDGQPTRVIAKSEVRFDRPLYAVTTDDREVVLCDGGHLWAYHSETSLRKTHLVKTAPARELAAWDRPNKPYLPRHAAVCYPEAHLPVDPYVLGAWLGDGTTGLGRMTAHPDDSPFMRAQFEAAGYTVTELADPYSFGVLGLREQLRGLGVLDDKHVPQAYLTSSVAQRTALLQGLMDTDGDVTAAGQCSFNNTNERLARAVRELVHSLGVKAKLHVYYDARPNHSPVYRVTFKLHGSARMPRKFERTYTPTDKRRRSIRVAATDQRADVQCVTVERADGQFLVGRGYVVTHNSEQDLKSGSKLPFEQAWSWYQTGPRQRLMWDAAIVLVMCMTGDTPVLLPDGTEKLLRDIRPGDEVATYENGQLTTARVTNWRSSGVDSIYTVQTQSGRILRANERHPFLVDFGGERKWVKLRELKPGMSLVATRGATAPHETKASRGSAGPAKQKPLTTESTLTRRITQWAITVSGRVCTALSVSAQPRFAGCAPFAISESTYRRALRRRIGHGASSIVTASRWSSMRRWLQNGAIAVTSVGRCLLARTLARIGAGSCASTTATTHAKSEGCCATTAISLSDTGVHPRPSCGPLSTYGVALDVVVSVLPAGREEVFDVEVARTENFIANGVVSHNTRWSGLDLTAKLLDYAARNPDADQWEVIEFPAILPSGKSLWPEKWPIEELEKTRASLQPRYWSAQYQQNPTSDDVAIIKREHWKIWEAEDPPPCQFVIQSWDTAHEASNSSDYSACTTWGVWVNENDRMTSHIILLDAFKDRMEFPELKQVAYEHWRKWDPDAFIIEKKAAGAPLIQELRRMGIPVQEFSPSRGNDKVVRANAVADIFHSGRVWAPDTRWAREVIEEMAAFPVGEHDDYVDTTTQALLRYRQGGFINLDSDEKEEKRGWRRQRAYY